MVQVSYFCSEIIRLKADKVHHVIRIWCDMNIRRGFVEDKQELTLGKYSFQVKNRNRARGAVLLDTNEGPRLMREYERIQGHFTFENEGKARLAQRGMSLTDQVVYNIEGNPVTEWESGEKFVVYQWYYGDSCDYRSTQALEKAARNLGQLHQHLRGMSEEPVQMEENLFMRYERRNREMKRVYQFMKSKKRKNEFELCALSCYPEFYRKAEQAAAYLQKSVYWQRRGTETRDVCHGEYNYHNLIYTKKGIATTNFEHAQYGIQLMDLAYFLRKVMEKNAWQKEKGRAVLEGYRSEAEMGAEEYEFLWTILFYPVKFWKLMSQYMNGKKSWISDKNMEKLFSVREKEAAKDKFLGETPNDHWS